MPGAPTRAPPSGGPSKGGSPAMGGRDGGTSTKPGSPLTLPPLPGPSGGTTSAFASGPIVIPNEHFLKPKPPPPMPWEMQYKERKARSKDPRMVKQCEDEAQWTHTCVAGVWQDVRRFALAQNDWMMTRQQLCELLAFWGIASLHLQAKTCELFDPKNTNRINGLVLTKLMELAVESEKLRPLLLRHVYDLFDKQGDRLSVRLLNGIQLAEPPPPGSPAAKKKKKASGLPMTTRSGATHRHVAAMRVMLTAISRANDDYVAFDEFAKVAFDPDQSYFVAACAPQIIEVMCAHCSPPHGELPLLSMRWLATTEPVAPGDVMYDADIVLLRAVEAAGGENAKEPKKRKKKG